MKTLKKLISFVLGCIIVGSSAAFAGCQMNTPTTSSSFEKSPTSEVIDDDVVKAKSPVLTVEGGEIQGYYSDDNTVCVYKGIPYAQAERFKAPVATSWEGVKDCTEWGASCIQSAEKAMGCYTAEFMGSSEIYSEDCQNLNVWTPNDDKTGKPVLVYFHGGAFVSGNASCKVYEGKGVAQKGVVYVSVNYRLGLFGFFANDELVAEGEQSNTPVGNYGILDQIAALKWVQENIEAFGGDPSNVTIMGQSAGAGSVNILTISPLAKGLFQRVASLSYNSVIAGEFSMGTLEEKVKGYKEALQKQSLPSTLAEMRAMSDEDFYKTYKTIWSIGASPCEPCIDGEVIPGNHAEILASGQANDVDMMIGTTTDDLAGEVVGLENNKAEAEAGETALWAYAHAVGGYQGNVYTYLFSHAMPGKVNYGAFHTSDVPYFLNVFTKLRDKYWTEEDYALGDRMSDYLVNFVKTGNPNGEGLAQWHENRSEYGTIDYHYIQLDVETTEKTLSERAQNCITAQYADLIAYMEGLKKS